LHQETNANIDYHEGTGELEEKLVVNSGLGKKRGEMEQKRKQNTHEEDEQEF
jgi:hypothetical protein